jgi:hypothetical protein
MLLIVALSVLGVVTVGSVVAYQRGATQRIKQLGKLGRDAVKQLPAHEVDEDAPTEERQLNNLRVGDIVARGDRDWIITGTLAYVEEGERWWLHRLEDGAASCWLEVRDRGGWTAAFLEPATDIPDFGQLYDGLTHKGMPYRLWRRGDARVSTSGDTGGREPGVVRYACYEGPGEGILNIDELGEGRVSLTGERVIAEGLDLMPGS